MVEPLRHRQTKEAATDMFNLQPPRHISTLPTLSKKSAARIFPTFCRTPTIGYCAIAQARTALVIRRGGAS